MKKIKTGKWSTLLAALVLTTGLSGVVQAADYTQGLTGAYKTDNKLVKGDGSSVKKQGNEIIYDFGGRDQSFSVVNQNVISFSQADNHFIVNNVDSSNGNKGTITLRVQNTIPNAFGGATGLNIGSGMTTIHSDLDIQTKADYLTQGVQVGGNGTLIIDGNVKMRKDDAENPWGVVTNNVHGNYGPGGYVTNDGLNYTGARWQPSGFYVGESRGNITVDGDVDIAIRGTAILTNTYNGADVDPYDLSTITLNGSSIRIVTPDDERKSDGSFKEAYYSLASFGGTVNVNVKNGEAQNGNVYMIGNVIASKRSAGTSASDVYQDGRINVALTTKDSYWKGVVDNFSKEQAGEVNVWLQNGAKWQHEAASRTNGMDAANMPNYSRPNYGLYDHVSYIHNFYGGMSAEKTGYLTQNHESQIHIDNYSGYATVIYQHNGSGMEKTDYIGGDTTIVHAATGSNITLATGNNGVDINDSNAVAKVLNALASKLIYSNYVNGESNLSGTVIIASGLTASSVKADVSGMITFDKQTGAGTYVKPQEGEQNTNHIQGGITGTTADNAYTDANIRKDDGTYKFTLSPTTITVENGTAIAANAKVNIDAKDTTLQLNAKTGIEANGHAVSIDAKKLAVGVETNHVENGILADGGSVTIAGDVDVLADKEAIHAKNKGKVTLGSGTIMGSILSDDSQISINQEKKASSVTGDLSVVNGGTIDLVVAGNGNAFTGNITKMAPEGTALMDLGNDGTVHLTVADKAMWKGGQNNADAALDLTLSGGSWTNTSTGDAVVRKLSGGDKAVKTIRYTDPADNGEKEIHVNGFISMGENAGSLTINNYSGTHIISYAHDNHGTDVNDYKGGDTHIKAAERGSMVIAATDSKGIQTSSQDAVENAFRALAQKFYYKGGDGNLTGKMLIASGLTSSSLSRFMGDMTFGTEQDGKGQYNGHLINISGDFETAIMKGARAAITSSLMSWRANADDLIYRGDLLRRNMEEEGLWARTYGGKDSYDSTGIDITNQYWGVQVGYDKVYPEGVIAGAAIDYQTGDSNYTYQDEDFGTVTGNTGKLKVYSIGLYGSKDLGNQDHFDLTVKAGSVGNDFTVYNGIGNELKGNYRNRAYSISSRYGKRFGSDKKYIEPQLQMTWSHVDANHFTAHSGEEELQIGQGSFDSVVGRIGVEAGRNGKYGTFYGKLDLAHEFKGAVRGTYYADDGGSKQTEVSMKDTWIEATMGTTLQLGENGTAYFDVSRTFGGEYEQEWKVNGGVRFAVGSGVTPGAKEKKAMLQKTLEAAKDESKGNKGTATTAAAETAPLKKINLVSNTAVTTKTAAKSTEENTASRKTPYEEASVETYSSASVSYEGDHDGTPVFTLGPVVVTANRVPQPILEAKADLSIVSRKEIEEMHIDTIESALRTVPGVQFLNYGANGVNANLSGIRINGSSDVVILVDGVRVTAMQGPGNSGYMYASLLNNMDNIDHIEVLKGAAGVTYGSGAKGGVINIITRKIDQTASTIDIGRGSFGKEIYNLNTQGRKGKLGYNVYSDRSIIGSTKDGAGKLWEGHTNTRSSGAKISYDFNANHSVTLNYDETHTHYNGQDYIYIGPYNGFYRSQMWSLTDDWKLSDLWHNSLTYRRSEVQDSYNKPLGEGDIHGTIGSPYTAASSYKYTFFSDALHYQSGKHSLVFGVDYTKAKGGSSNTGTGRTASDKWLKSTSYYMQDDWEILPKLTLSGGIRWDRPESAAGLSQMKNHRSESYKLSWDMTEKDTIYAGRSDFYILPGMDQLFDPKYGNQSLEASYGRTTSIGYNRKFSDRSYLTLNWFKTETEVGIGYKSNDDTTDNTFVNYHNGVSRGWNAEYHVQLNDNWSARLGWSHLFYDDGGTYDLGYAPKDKATFSINYSKDKFSAALDGFYFIRDTRNVKVPKAWPSDKYAIFNLSLNYAANKETTFYLKVDNLFNKLWADRTNVIWQGGPESWYSMPGRSLTMGMKLRF